jgi:hypothetical protein
MATANRRFGFVVSDVRRQLEVSRDMMERVKILEKLIETESSDEKKILLENLRDGIVHWARELARNAEVTSNTANNALVSGTGTGSAW